MKKKLIKNTKSEKKTKFRNYYSKVKVGMLKVN